MTSLTKSLANANLHKIQQVVKWVVYTLLIINFAFYIYEDWDRALHTLTAESTFLEWASEFATSIDESAWFLLLFMFELETYVLEDEDWTGWVAHTVRGVRLICFVMIAHTIYAFGNTVIDYERTNAVENVSSLCDMVSQDVSYVYNLEYTAVDEQTCRELTDESQFYWLGDNPLVTTLAGLNLERNLAWADLIEAITWLLIIVSIETVVRLQGNGITGGPVIFTAYALKIILYLMLFVLAAYWATLSHWLYTWDEFVWIAGFAAIEMNVSEWRDELVGEQEIAAVQG